MKPWIVGLLTAGAGAAVGAVAALSQRGRGLGAVRNPDEVHPFIRGEIDKYESRARAAGASGELDYVGAGGEGVVFCDTRGKAYKVGRGTRGEQGMRDEAEWLAMAASIPNIKTHVPKFFRYDADNDVIVRECLVVKEQREYRRKPRKLWELHHRVASVMATYGYGRPEFKDDSWVLTRRGPVLVDAGFAIRSGHPLVRDVLDAVNGRKKLKPIDVKQLAFEVRHERGKTIPAPVANKLLKRLQALEPSVELDGLRSAGKLRLDIADYDAVDALREAAKSGERFGGRKVFLSSIVDMKDAQTRRVLLALHRDGLIELTRADLVAAMDPKLVKASELDAEGATYHFLVDGLGAPRKARMRTKKLADQRDWQWVMLAQEGDEHAAERLAEILGFKHEAVARVISVDDDSAVVAIDYDGSELERVRVR